VGRCWAGALATVKSFVESVCITILTDSVKELRSELPGTPELFVEAPKPLGLQHTRDASKIDKLLSAHNKLCDALNDMRNDNDPTAHERGCCTFKHCKNQPNEHFGSMENALSFNAHHSIKKSVFAGPGAGGMLCQEFNPPG